MVRGEYATRLKESSNIVVHDPEIAAAIQNTKAVNDALRGLLELAKTSTRLSPLSGSVPIQAKTSIRIEPVGGGSRLVGLVLGRGLTPRPPSMLALLSSPGWEA